VKDIITIEKKKFSLKKGNKKIKKKIKFSLFYFKKFLKKPKKYGRKKKLKGEKMVLTDKKQNEDINANQWAIVRDLNKYQH